jgi:hypothetical protein
MRRARVEKLPDDSERFKKAASLDSKKAITPPTAEKKTLACAASLAIRSDHSP